MEPIMSVSGIRGIAGETFTERLCAEVAFVQARICGGGRMVVARDSRPSGAAYARAAAAGIRAAGGQPVDVGIAPTPTACVAVDHLKASGGIILTASHNPAPYNGYKMIHRTGRLCSGAECENVYRGYRAGEGRSVLMNETKFPDTTQIFDAATVHIERIVKIVDARRIAKAGLSIAVDAVNGAAGAAVPLLLDKLGVTWRGLNMPPTGAFTHNPEPRPEHLTELSSLLAATPGAWGGFAFDPDADRLATMGERGEPISEEFTLALALTNILARDKTDVATNLSTSMVIDDVARSFGVRVFRSKIGEANVVEAMQRNGCRAGGEGNGGVIYPAISTVRDGLAGLALILELMANTGKRLTQLADRLPHYAMVKEKIPAAGKDPQELLRRLAGQFANDELDTQDGLKIIRRDCWVHLRPSNTEPILRCFAEAPTTERAQELVSAVLHACE